MKFSDKIHLSFDDVLLAPRRSRVKSRLDPSVETRLTKNFNINLPLATAAMDTVINSDVAIILSKLGGAPFLHRFMDDEKIIDTIKTIKHYGGWCVASVGIREDIVRWCISLQEAGAVCISFDIAHGHNVEMLKSIELCKKVLSIDIIGGNVCTAGGVRDLINAGADAVKANIGPGSACGTRITTGCGKPTFSTIVECVDEANKYSIPVISDGGMKNSGDVSKNLAAGAECCMLGYLFSQAEEAPGENITYPGNKRFKTFRGMASEEAQRVFKGGMKSGTAAEGESMLVPVVGPLEKIVEELIGGLRSCMSYCDAHTIRELQENAEFIRISPSSYREGLPFGLELSKMGRSE